MKPWLSLVIVLIATPAFARLDTAPFAERTIGPWDVYLQDKDCWMARSATNGDEFKLSTSADDTELYVVMRRKAWTFIKEDAALPMRVQFTGTDVTKQGSGSLGHGKLTPGVVVFLNDRKRDYIADLRHSRTVRTWLNGKPALTADMSNAGPALDYFAQCTARIRRQLT